MTRSHPKTTYLAPPIVGYTMAHTTPPDQLLEELVAETERTAPQRFMMQIDPNQGTLLTMLARLLNARFIVEVGTFTGHSSICLARGLAPGGRLLCLDVSEEWTAVARRYWERAGLSDRIELRLGPAGESLRALPLEESIDLAFIDADKPGYPDYYREILRRLRPGGLIAVDNVLWSGRVADPANHDPSTQTIREFNDMVIADDRVTSVMLPIADGVTLIRKEG